MLEDEVFVKAMAHLSCWVTFFPSSTKNRQAVVSRLVELRVANQSECVKFNRDLN